VNVSTRRRYIALIGDPDNREAWVLWVGSRKVRTLTRTTINPPQSITEGLPFEPQYDSVVAAEGGGDPICWVYDPPRGPAVGWALVAAGAVATALIPKWSVMVVLAVILFTSAALREANR